MQLEHRIWRNLTIQLRGCLDFCNELIKLSKPQTTHPLPIWHENKKDNCSNLVIWTSIMTNIRIQKLLLLVTSFFYLTNKEAAKAECVITFFDNFIFLCAIHEKHDFKYLKNPTVKVCKIRCNNVYMYIFFTVTFFGGN